jgi:hypothetical protein
MFMNASTKKRHKTYRPKRVHLPIMGELRNDFAAVLLGSITAARYGLFSEEQFHKLGGCLNCILGALIIKPPKDPAMLAVIEGAARAMNQCGRRGFGTNVWKLTDFECATVYAGIKKAEESLLYLGVFEINESMGRLKSEQIDAGWETTFKLGEVDHETP